jgi:two-component system cell cycle sensor histidine kinase/response regulator CckA
MKAIETQPHLLASPGPGSTGGGLSALTVIASGALVVLLIMFGLLATGSVATVVLAVLSLLSVAGVFFVFGLLSGFVRLESSAVTASIGLAAHDQSDTAVELVRADGAVLYANRAAALLRAGHGGSIEDMLARHPQCAEPVYRLATSAMRGEIRHEELWLPSARMAGVGASSTTGCWLRITVRPFSPSVGVSEAGPLALWQVVDISADRQREAAAVGQLEQALSYFDGMPVGVAGLAADGRIVHFNATLQRMLGLSASTGRVPSLTIGDVLSIDSAALVLNAATGSTPAPTHFDLDLVREDGTLAPVQLMLRTGTQSLHDGLQTLLFLERDNNAVRTVANGSVEDRFARLFHAAPFGIATLDSAGAVISSNAAFSRLFPGSGDRAEVLVDRMPSAGNSEQRAVVRVALERALAGRTGSPPIEISSGIDGEVARRLYIHPLTVGNDPREAAIVYVADATEQKALELKFAQSQKMEAVGKLAGGIAHDFNNVLTVIIGLSDLLLQVRRPTDPGYNDISQIKNNANRAAGMVRQLLAFSRKQTLAPETLAVNDVIQDYAFTLKKMIGEKIDLKIQPARDLWYVRADKTQFGQVLFNLAVNAKDAMPEGGRLRVHTKNVTERESLKLSGKGMQAGEFVLVEIEDSGTGMSAEVMAKIFDPFFTTKDVGKGTGLGLSTVYGIVKQTGGFIYADSEIGRGTTFRVYLPRHIPDADEEIETATAASTKKKEPSRDLTGTGRVLLVEDEDGVRSFAVRALQRQGYEVLEAASGVEALEVLAEAGGKVDIVVSDVIMPEMDGPSMYKEMLKTKPDLKIIFVSGYPSDAFEKSLGPDMAFAFLPKPFTLPQLAAKVKEELGR